MPPNKPLYRSFLMTLLALGWWFAVFRVDRKDAFETYWGQTTPEAFSAALSIAGLAALITFSVFWFMLVYKAWAAIQDEHTPITPGVAVGFCFIPLFGFYWVFRAFGGYPRAFNEYAIRNGLTGLELKRAPFVAFAIFWVLSATPYGTGLLFMFPAMLVLFWKVSGDMCDAITAASDDWSPKSDVSAGSRAIVVLGACAAFGLALSALVHFDHDETSVHVFVPWMATWRPAATLFLALLMFAFLATRRRVGTPALLAGLACGLLIYWIALQQVHLVRYVGDWPLGQLLEGVPNEIYWTLVVYTLGETAFWVFTCVWLFAAPMHGLARGLLAIPCGLMALIMLAATGFILVEEPLETRIRVQTVLDGSRMLATAALGVALIVVAVRMGRPREGVQSK